MRLVWLVLLTLTLAGCGESKEPPVVKGVEDQPADPTNEPDPEPGDPVEEPSTGPSEPGDPEPTNEPPVAVLAASVESGEAPLQVMFDMDGSDAEGDITWSLDVDADGIKEVNGTELPATYEHIFEAGEYEAVLEVSDGTHLVQARVNLSVSSAPQPASQSVSGSYTLAAEGCVAPIYELGETDAGAAASGSTDGAIRIQFDVDPGTIGASYEAVWVFDQGYLYGAVDFWDADGALVQTDNTGQGANFGDLTITGTVPEGAAIGVLFACAGPTQASVTYQAG